MTDLFFFTSNAAKLANVRHILRGSRYNVLSFRQETYHKGYDEPRIVDREELLLRSYESALEQAQKAKRANGSFFFLEDTSVEILALSSDRETPGVDVKYWMREHDFASVDRMLREHGNDRRVVVRSHVVLHVPRPMRPTLRYQVFVGEQHGTIVKREVAFEPNLLHIWLDNQTFNKWFCPGREDRPFGSMTVQEADNYDFRRCSILAMTNFLDAILPPDERSDRNQLSLALQRPECLVVCGYTCAGKTTLGQRLAERFGYLHVEASDFMQRSYRDRHGARPKVSLTDFAKEALRQHPTIAAEQVLEHLSDSRATPWVVTGFRAPEEIVWFRDALISHGVGCRFVFVDATAETRFERFVARGRSGDTPSVADFTRKDDAQRSMGLDAIRALEDVEIVPNNADIAAFYGWTDALHQSRSNVPAAAMSQTIPPVVEIALEDAILVTLLEHWQPGENGPAMTTSHIARLIVRTFPDLTKPKHKDNVSRYFNQQFRAYYEYIPACADEDSPMTYRLSNTGRGEAMLRRSRLFFGRVIRS